MKAELKRLKKSINEKTVLETEYEVYEKDLKSAKKLRKQLSEELQQWLFSQELKTFWKHHIRQK